MAGSSRRYTLAAILLPLLFLAMSAIARAATITVTTLADPTGASGTCSLRDAITAANTTTATNNCVAGTGSDTINFSVSGTIALGSFLPAIINASPGSLTIDGSGQTITVSGANSVLIFSVDGGATVSLQNLTIANGRTTGSEAAGINNFGALTVNNCTLSGNSGMLGGAILNQSTMTVTNSTFTDNSSVNGGAIDNNSKGTATVINSTFYDNHGSEAVPVGIANFKQMAAVKGAPLIVTYGGAIINWNEITLTNCTFSGNQASEASPTALDGIAENGGAIYNVEGTVSLKSTILADSTGGNCEGTVAVTDAGYNISDDDTCPTTSGTSVDSSTALNLSPAGLADNGGPTDTIALEPNSEAVDFIPVASCTDQSSPTLLPVTTDQRGEPRPDPGNPNFCDAGAYELQTTPFVLAPNSERVQIARSSYPHSDQVNMAFTFIENGFPACDAGDDAFNGFTVLLRTGSCGALDDAALELGLEPWVVHTVNHQSYGTLFISDPPATLSARMVELPTPPAPACGEWTINIEIAGIDSYSLGNGPFALVLTNPDGDTGCFDITNAIVGHQIDPPTRSVRRGVRR